MNVAKTLSSVNVDVFMNSVGRLSPASSSGRSGTLVEDDLFRRRKPRVFFESSTLIV